MSKYPKHSDLDAKLWPAMDSHPTELFFKLGGIATALLVVISWLIIIALVAGGVIEWEWWYFVVVPIVLWIGLLALPMFFSARRGALAIMDAIAKTAEAWLARAGYSIDLNNDGYIGHVQTIEVNPPQPKLIEPVKWTRGNETKLLTNTAPSIAEAPEPSQTEDRPQPVNIERRLWRCPNGYQVPVTALEYFVDEVFDGRSGWSRGEWVPAIDREEYDAIMLQLEQAKLIEGRKPRHKGKKTVDSARKARMVLGLPVKSQG